eukprot:1003171-Amphidinium_carterae.1
MEYQTPGADVRTLVVQGLVRKCNIRTTLGLAKGLNYKPWDRETIQCWMLLEPTLRSARTLQSRTCKPLSFQDDPI